ncbi:hypothetical protein D9756_002271 [Leucocoprinus leucothites]|uniref:Zn(2)-C6 fungal-type domain-containing protein n=1 Tax=Leucocoprinus leucothites TaxID=201217 RepID=A0A8H5GBZ0_9AGAR|nr:hypothetical protein D9756_002271 [Leucoagaricus leucothites]
MTLSELPIKRKRGANRLNCAECRRLKLRCDRAIPCSSCVKRGCGAICPSGSLTAGQGRYVLASTEELHERISLLTYRIRELEDALRTQHASLSSDTHPLLTKELLNIKAPAQKDPCHGRNDSTSSQMEDEHGPDVGDTFGSMSNTTSCESRYYGHTANSWYFFQNGADAFKFRGSDETAFTPQPRNLLPERKQRTTATLYSGCTQFDDYSLEKLLCSLPRSSTIVLELRNVYYAHAAWMYNPVSAEVFDNEIYSTFYDRGAEHNNSLCDLLDDHSLSMYNVDAEHFYQLARAALFQAPLLEAPNIYAVQALFLMSFYLFLAERHGSTSETRWAMMGMAIKAAQAVGLHRDSSLWGFDVADIQHRRELFWELFTYDSCQSLTFGRPASFPISHIDCKQPHITDDVSCNDAFHAWKHRFTSECISLLHDQAFGARGATYANTLQLDKRIRAFPIPPVLELSLVSSESSPPGYSVNTALALQRHVVVALRETNILYLHRSFFAKAIRDYPDDLLQSPYRESVEAAFHSAQKLVAMMKSLSTQYQGPCERLWFLWTHLFSCSVVLASIVTRSPGIYLAPSSLAQLDVLCGLFSKVASNFRATTALDTMLDLQRKAHRALKDYHQGRREHNLHSAPGPSRESVDKELEMLKGNINRSIQSVSPSPSRHSTSLSLPPSPDRCYSGDLKESDVIDDPLYPSAPSGITHTETASQRESPAVGMTPFAPPAYSGYTGSACSAPDVSSSLYTQPFPSTMQSPEQAAMCTVNTVACETANNSFLGPANNAGCDNSALLLSRQFEASGYLQGLTGDIFMEWPQEGMPSAVFPYPASVDLDMLEWQNLVNDM